MLVKSLVYVLIAEVGLVTVDLFSSKESFLLFISISLLSVVTKLMVSSLILGAAFSKYFQYKVVITSSSLKSELKIEK